MEKTVRRGFAFILIIIPLLMFLAYHIPQNIVFNPAKQMQLQPLTPLTTQQTSNDTTISTFDVSDREPARNALFVQAKHCDISISSNGELLFSMQRGEKPWMNSTGTTFHIVNLPSHIKDLEMTVRNLYPNITGTHALLGTGNDAALYRTATKKSFVASIISITEVFIGCVLLIFWFFFQKSGQRQYALFYLALFSFAVGLWSLAGNSDYILILNNQAAASSAAFITLMFFVVPFTQFAKFYFGYSHRFADLLSLSSIFFTALLISLHLFGVAGFKQTVTVTHIHIAASALFYAYSLTRYLVSGTKSRRKLINVVATVILLGSAVFDFSVYFSDVIQTYFMGRFGFIIYFFILGTETINTMIVNLQKSRKNAIYKEMAYTDNLTKLNNRNAFMELERNTTDPGAVTVINIDLNDLKKCNDNYGHVYGDKYIADSARIIYDTFKGFGDCYRIGGDEFAVMIDSTYSNSDIENFIKTLEEKQAAYNETSEVIHMQMAYGYATFDPDIDRNLESVCTRADAKMYEHKKALKALTGGEIR